MAGINIVDEVKQIDNDGNVAKIDEISGALYTIPVEHGIIHQGKGFFLGVDAVVDVGDTYDILIVTPSDKDMHLMAHQVTATSSPGEFCIHESVTASVSGDEIDFNNNNRQSDIEPSVKAYINPTIDDTGVELDCDMLAGTKLSGGSTLDYASEWILKRNTLYLFRYTNASGIRTDINISTFHMEL